MGKKSEQTVIGKDTKLGVVAKSFATAALLLGSGVALCGCSQTSGTVTGQCAEAITNGDYAEATNLATGAIGRSEYDKALYRLRGIAELGEGQFDKAIGDFMQSLQLSNGIVNSSDIDTSYYLATAEFKSGDYEASETTLTAITNIKPKEDRAFYLRGKVKLAGGDKTGAMVDFDRAIGIAPTKYDYYVGIYEDLAGAGYETEGKAYLEKAISAGNRLSDYNKGVIEYYMGSYTDARNDLENAKKSGENENVILYLARTYEALGDLGYAQNLLETFTLANSGCGKAYGELAYLKMTQKDYEGALSTIETGLTSGGGEGKRGLMFNKVVAYENINDFKSAKAAMDEYLALYPDDTVARRESVFLSSR